MADDLILHDITGKPLNASVDVSDLGLVIDSRSGKDHNRDYRKALALALARSDAAVLPIRCTAKAPPFRIFRCCSGDCLWTGLTARRSHQCLRCLVPA